jgi:hypothetical protein
VSKGDNNGIRVEAYPHVCPPTTRRDNGDPGTDVTYDRVSGTIVKAA